MKYKLIARAIMLSGCAVNNPRPIQLRVTEIKPGSGCTEVYMKHRQELWMGCFKNLPSNVHVGNLITVNTKEADTTCTLTRIK
jgi:hypothetical protein